MEQPFFSIIIPTYNAGSTIVSCLESIVIQNFKQYEVLVIDGRSTDETIELVEEYKNNFQTIKIISEKDRGIYDAMNKGIGLSEGKWLYFLGSDDKLYNTGVLGEIFTVIKSDEQISVLYGNVYSERFKGTYDGIFDSSKIRKRNINHQAIFFKKDIFDKTGNFNLKYKSQADWDHNLKWFLSTQIKNKFIDKTIACYSDGGFSSVNGDNVFYADLNFNYIRYGKKTISFFKKIKLLIYEFFKSVKRMDIQRFKKVLVHLKYI